MRVTYWMFGGALLLALVACNSNHQNFNTMTEEEIFAYNLGKPIMDQVVCQERRSIASRISNNVCMTIREMTTERDKGYRKLQVINHRSTASSFADSGR